MGSSYGGPCPARNSPSVLILQRARPGGDEHISGIVRNDPATWHPISSCQSSDCFGTLLAASPHCQRTRGATLGSLGAARTATARYSRRAHHEHPPRPVGPAA